MEKEFQHYQDDLFKFLRFQSISADKNYEGEVRKCADWLVAKFEKMGFDVESNQDFGLPIVLARSKFSPEKKTVLIYGHYDVQPPDPMELWQTKPFEPVIKNYRIFSRGSTDNKGQIFAHICGVEDWLTENDELPVNLIFLIEGEEEIGSPALQKFLHNNKPKLQSDIVLISDTGMLAEDLPTLTYGLRGIAYLEVFITGADSDLHSGIYGGAVPNPANELSRLLALVKAPDGKITLPNFYEKVETIDGWERQHWQGLPFGDEMLKANTGLAKLQCEEGFSALESCWARPTFDINGLTSGYQGEGSKTIIPSRASAKVSFRLVPNQEPAEVAIKFCDFMRDNCRSGLKIDFKVGHAGEAYYFNPHSKYGKLAQEVLSKTFNTSQVALIREGGSIPVVQSFKKILGVDSLLMGFALPDAKIHAPNENFPVKNFMACIRANNNFLRCFIN